MTTSVPTLTGEPVEISYVADPHVGRGEFVLANPGPAPLSASVETAWFEADAQRRPLSGVTVFDLDHDQTLDAHALRVEAGDTLRFWLGFPRIAYEPQVGEAAAVGLRLRAGDTLLEARSPVRFLRRWPRGAG
jgi:hypothetical protein